MLQIVGFTLTYTAFSGMADDIRVQLTGGTYTPPNSGVPLTSETYTISDPAGFFSVETYCASDPSATCTANAAGDTVTCTAIVEEIDVFAGDKDDAVDATGVPAPLVIGGGGNNDILKGGMNDDSIGGGDGADEVYGYGGNDVLTGGPVGDYVEGGAGNDDMKGEGGDDTIKGGPGQDTLDGGGDTDTLDYSDLTAAVMVDLSAATGGSAQAGPAGDKDTVKDGFENVAGGSGNDTLIGQDDANVLQGGPGDDVLNGAGGEDLLQGGDGKDMLIDTNEGGSYNADTFEGGNGADRLIGGSGFNTLRGGDGDDWLIAGCDSGGLLVREGSRLFGDAGDDTLSEPAPCSSVGMGEAQDHLSGGGGNDTADYCAEDNPRSASIPLGYRPLPNRDWTSCTRTANQDI